MKSASQSMRQDPPDYPRRRSRPSKMASTSGRSSFANQSSSSTSGHINMGRVVLNTLLCTFVLSHHLSGGGHRADCHRPEEPGSDKLHRPAASSDPLIAAASGQVEHPEALAFAQANSDRHNASPFNARTEPRYQLTSLPAADNSSGGEFRFGPAHDEGDGDGDDDDDDEHIKNHSTANLSNGSLTTEVGLTSSLHDRLATVKHLLETTHQQTAPLANSTDDESTAGATPTACTHKGRDYSDGQTVPIEDQPCLNCTCRRAILQCYLRICPPVVSLEAAFKRLRSSEAGAEEGYAGARHAGACRLVKEPRQCCPTMRCDAPLQAVGVVNVPNRRLDFVDEPTGDHQERQSDSMQALASTHEAPSLARSVRNESAAAAARNASETPPGVQLDQLPKLTVINAGPSGQRESILLITSNPHSTLVSRHNPGAGRGNESALALRTSGGASSRDSSLIEALLETLYANAAQLNGLNLQGSCMINGSLYIEGSAVAPESSANCQYCYCIRQKVMCVRPRCHLMISGCTPKYSHEFACCPTSYQCAPSPGAGLLSSGAASQLLNEAQLVAFRNAAHPNSARLTIGSNSSGNSGGGDLTARIAAVMEDALKLTSDNSSGRDANLHPASSAAATNRDLDGLTPRQMDPKATIANSSSAAEVPPPPPTTTTTTSDFGDVAGGTKSIVMSLLNSILSGEEGKPAGEQTVAPVSNATTPSSNTNTSSTLTTPAPGEKPASGSESDSGTDEDQGEGDDSAEEEKAGNNSTTSANGKKKEDAIDDKPVELSRVPTVSTTTGKPKRRRQPNNNSNKRNTSNVTDPATNNNRNSNANNSHTNDSATSVSDFLEPMNKLGPHVVAPTVPFGCIENGRTYAIGEQIPTLESCKHCYCGPDGVKECKMVECSLRVAHGCRPVTPQGHCCPVRYECPPAGNATATASPDATASSRYRGAPEDNELSVDRFVGQLKSSTGLGEEGSECAGQSGGSSPSGAGNSDSLDNIPGLMQVDEPADKAAAAPAPPLHKTTRLISGDNETSSLATLTDELNKFIMQINANNQSGATSTSSPSASPSPSSTPAGELPSPARPEPAPAGDYHSVQPASGNEFAPIPRGMMGIPSIEPEPIGNPPQEPRFLAPGPATMMGPFDTTTTLGPLAGGDRGDVSSAPPLMSMVEYVTNSTESMAAVQQGRAASDSSSRDMRSTNAHKLNFEPNANGSLLDFDGHFVANNSAPFDHFQPAAPTLLPNEIPVNMSDDYADAIEGLKLRNATPSVPHIRLLRNHHSGPHSNRQRQPSMVVFDDDALANSGIRAPTFNQTSPFSELLANNNNNNNNNSATTPNDPTTLSFDNNDPASTPNPLQPTTGTPIGLDADRTVSPTTSAWLKPLPYWIRSFGQRLSGNELQGAASGPTSNQNQAQALKLVGRSIDEGPARGASRHQSSSFLNVLRSIIASDRQQQAEGAPPTNGQLVMRPIGEAFHTTTANPPATRQLGGSQQEHRMRQMHSLAPYDAASGSDELEIVTAAVPYEPEVFGMGRDARQPRGDKSNETREMVVVASSSFARRSDVANDDESVASEPKPPHADGDNMVRYISGVAQASGPQPPKAAQPAAVGEQASSRPTSVRGHRVACHDLATNKTYQANEIIPKDDPCTTCTCVLGEELCQTLVCPEKPAEDCREEHRPGQCCASYLCGNSVSRAPSESVSSLEGQQRPSINTDQSKPAEGQNGRLVSSGSAMFSGASLQRAQQAAHQQHQQQQRQTVAATQRAINVDSANWNTIGNGLTTFRQQQQQASGGPSQTAQVSGRLAPPVGNPIVSRQQLPPSPIRTNDLANLLPSHLRFRPNLLNGPQLFGSSYERNRFFPLSANQQPTSNNSEQFLRSQKNPLGRLPLEPLPTMNANAMQPRSDLATSAGSNQQPSRILFNQQLHEQLLRNYQQHQQQQHQQQRNPVRQQTLLPPPRSPSFIPAPASNFPAQQPAVTRRNDEIVPQQARTVPLSPSALPAQTYASLSQQVGANNVLFQQTPSNQLTPHNNGVSSFGLNSNNVDSGFRPIAAPTPVVLDPSNRQWATGGASTTSSPLSPTAADSPAVESTQPSTGQVTTSQPSNEPAATSPQLEPFRVVFESSSASNRVSDSKQQPSTTANVDFTTTFASTTTDDQQRTTLAPTSTSTERQFSSEPKEQQQSTRESNVATSDPTPESHASGSVDSLHSTSPLAIHDSESITSSTTSTSTPTDEPADEALDPFSFKVSECDIYGRVYRVGQPIEELSGKCKRCTCTSNGVECESKC